MKMENDASFTRREGEEEMFAFIRQPVKDAMTSTMRTRDLVDPRRLARYINTYM